VAVVGKFGEVDGEFRNVKMVGTVERAWECGEQGFFATSAKAEIDSVGFFNGAVGFFFFLTIWLFSSRKSGGRSSTFVCVLYCSQGRRNSKLLVIFFYFIYFLL